MDAASTPGAGHCLPGEPEPVTERIAAWRRRHPVLVQLVRYAIIGGGSTALTAGLFLALRSWFDAVPANLVALVITTAVSTEANRRFAFGGARAHRLREWVQDVGTVVFYAGYTSAVLVVLHLLVPSSSPLQEAIAVAVASVAGGTARFLVLRYWVFERVRH
ncbi:MAG: GtrA family protein [Pseudonocardia sp.]|nr:GtrA family protein [Pseudonocardia sp.]